ncbi:MAG TPA: hypothetical protein VK525_03410 [Candidatus Saccharimonadales bacterium]|nr:hypothetical protein [Candidatus Saccharimonadales bacterium]
MDLCGYRRLVSILLLGLSVVAFASTAFADSFDVPLKRKVVDFGLSENNPPGGRHLRVKLYCFLYLNFMIKEYDDEGKKGAVWVAIVPIQKGPAPACARTHASGERILKWPEWSGYFNGVKGNLVFLNDADGTDGGMPFTIFDFRTGNKIFRDSAYNAAMWNEKPASSPFNRLRFTGDHDSDLTMRYLRVVEAGCDLYTEKSICWEQVRKKLELKSPRMPVCTGYENVSSRYPSAVAYPVEVSLFPQPATKTIAGPIRCWPVD